MLKHCCISILYLLMAIPLQSQNLTVKEKDGLYGFFERKKMVLDFQYDTITPFQDGSYGVKKNGKWGLVEAYGKEILPCKFDRYRSIANKKYIAAYEGLEGVIDSVGVTIIDFLFDQIDHLQDSQALVKYNGEWCIYNNGSFSYDTTKFIFTRPEHLALFPGCDQYSLPDTELKYCSVEKMYQYFSENITYPIEARRKGIEGQVFAVFIVTKHGEIQNPVILRGLGGGCDEEVLRIINSMPVWIPATQDEKIVTSQYSIPVKFQLKG